MGPNNKLAIAISKSSPLFEYWESPQGKEDDQKRLSKAVFEEPAAVLFIKEPYKWEILFQSVTREVKNGDHNSIKGLRILIEMLNAQEKIKIFQNLSSQEIFDDEMIATLKGKDRKKETTKHNPARFIRILFNIFTNPYCIEMKGKKIHIYEKTGSILYQLKTFHKNQPRHKEPDQKSNKMKI